MHTHTEDVSHRRCPGVIEPTTEHELTSATFPYYLGFSVAGQPIGNLCLGEMFPLMLSGYMKPQANPLSLLG